MVLKLAPFVLQTVTDSFTREGVASFNAGSADEAELAAGSDPALLASRIRWLREVPGSHKSELGKLEITEVRVKKE
jgi:hypothetical protein